MKTCKKILSGILLLTLLLISTSLPACAATADISFKGTATVGKTITVSIPIKASIEWCAADFTLHYSEDILQFQDADCMYNAAGGGVISAAPATTNGYSHTFNFTFKAIKAGMATVSISGEAANESTAESFSKSSSLTVKDVTKSDNANLKALSLKEASLSPSFSASKTSYTATVSKSVTKCTVYATTADSKATFSVSGNSNLSIGDNKVTVTVTSESGSQKIYTVTVTRSEKEESSEPESTGEDTENPDGEPLETEIGDQKYTLATDLTGVVIPNGFTAASAEYRETTVAVAKDKNETYTIYYLKNTEDTEGTFSPYLLESDQFVKLPTVTYGDNTYIIADFPDGSVPPSGYYATTLTLNDMPVLCYHGESSDPDFYYLYCFFTDSFGVYRYDKKEDNLQRYPEFYLSRAAAVTATQATNQPKGFLERFASLSSGAKMILVLVFLAVLLILALIVFAYLHLMRSRRKNLELVEDNLAFAGESDVFDDIQIEDETEAPSENDE